MSADAAIEERQLKLLLVAKRHHLSRGDLKHLVNYLESEDSEKIKARSQEVTEAAMKLGEAIYKSEQENTPEENSESLDTTSCGTPTPVALV